MSSNIRVNSITPAVGNNVAIGTAGGTITFNCDTISGIATFANDIDITQTLDVDGHTNLDNVSVSGVSTFSSNINLPDNTSVLFGTDDDGKIKHTGSNLQIQETTGNIQITNYANDLDVDISSDDGSGGTTNYFKADGSTGETLLYHYGNEKIKTTSTGVSITGNNVISGNVSAVDATFSGNVSIAGTLTYEDVTNIDSVGVITARSGIHVTGTGANGRIGIGTDNPSEQLHLFSSSTSEIKVETTGTYSPATLELKSPSNGRIDFRATTGDAAGRILYSHVDDDMRFSTKAPGGSRSEKLRLTGIGSIGIGITNPATDVDISQKTGAVALPQGTTAQRPTGSAPYIRKNTTNNALEYYDGTSWVEIITDYFPTGSVILG